MPGVLPALRRREALAVPLLSAAAGFLGKPLSSFVMDAFQQTCNAQRDTALFAVLRRREALAAAKLSAAAGVLGERPNPHHAWDAFQWKCMLIVVART